MGVFGNLISGFVHLCLVAADILFFFLILKLLCYRWDNRWLRAFAAAGTPLVDWYTGCIQKGLSCINCKTHSEKLLTVLGALALLVFELFLGVLLHE